MDKECRTSLPNKIIVCTGSQQSKGFEKLGPFIIRYIQSSLDFADHANANTPLVCGEACLTRHTFSCVAAFLSDNKINYLPGSVQTNAKIATIVVFAYQNWRSRLGWTRSQDGRASLQREMIAGTPASKTVSNIRDGGGK